MITCRLTHCPKIGTCKLESNGAIDLCPVLRTIKAEAVEATERAWEDKFPHHEVVPLEHYQGTWGTTAEGFTLDLGLGKIAALEIARRKATLEKEAYYSKHKLTPVEPRPEPKKTVPEKSNLDFHEMPTLTNEYCAYPPLDHVEDIEAKELKAKADVTKVQKRRWQDYSAKKKIISKRMRNHNYYMQMEDNMRINK